MKMDAIVMVRLPAELKERAEQVGKEEDRPVSWLIRTALEEYLERRKPAGQT